MGALHVKMVDLSTSGSMGDALLTAHKLVGHPGPFHLHHWIGPDPLPKWEADIERLLRLAPGVQEVGFCPGRNIVHPRIFSSAHTDDDPDWVKMQYYPSLMEDHELGTVEAPRGPYLAIQVNAGQPGGRNSKILSSKMVTEFVQGSELPAVLLGTEQCYSDCGADYDYIGKASLFDTMWLAVHAKRFIGPEGLLAFSALSGKVAALVFFTSFQAIKMRIIGTPWQDHVTLVQMQSGDNGLMEFLA